MLCIGYLISLILCHHTYKVHIFLFAIDMEVGLLQGVSNCVFSLSNVVPSEILHTTTEHGKDDKKGD